MPNPLEEALVRLIEETSKTERVLRDRQAVREVGGEALAALFGSPQPKAQVEPVAPPSGSSTPAPASSSGEIDWTSTDAAIDARRKAEETPTPDPAPAVSSEPGTDAAMLAMLNTPTGENPA